MAPCLCAPPTHEGSFRCRLHRGHPLAVSPIQFGSEGAALSNCENPADRPCLVHVRQLPFSATPSRQLNFDPPTLSRSVSASSSTPPSPSASSIFSSNRNRPPSVRRTVSSSAPPSRSTSNSPTSLTATAPARCSSPSASHAVALAIMKQHMHNKHGRSHLNGSNALPRCSGGYKIGPSRLSQMARAGTDEAAVLKKVDCSIANLPGAFQLKTSLLYSVEPQARQSTAMEPRRNNLEIRPVIPKFKQSESSCKLVGYNAGPFMVPTVY